MTYVAITSYATLASTFLVALWGKANGRAAFRAFVAGLGEMGPINRRFRAPAAVLVISNEGVALLLLVIWPGAAAGLVLSIVVPATFTAGLAVSLIRGVREPCHCFGASVAPLSWWHVLRNAVLLAIAAVALIGGPVQAAEPGGTVLAVSAGIAVAALIIRVFTAATVFAVVLTLANLLLLLGVIRRLRELSTASHDDLAGNLVGFFTPGCPACVERLPEFISHARQKTPDQTVAVLVGEPEELTEMIEPRAVAGVVLEPPQGPVAQAFEVKGFPALALLDASGTLPMRPRPPE
jgi:hypothetical protein